MDGHLSVTISSQRSEGKPASSDMTGSKTSPDARNLRGEVGHLQDPFVDPFHDVLLIVP